MQCIDDLMAITGFSMIKIFLNCIGGVITNGISVLLKSLSINGETVIHC